MAFCSWQQPFCEINMFNYEANFGIGFCGPRNRAMVRFDTHFCVVAVLQPAAAYYASIGVILTAS
jgi:hypothetical protein